MRSAARRERTRRDNAVAGAEQSGKDVAADEPVRAGQQDGGQRFLGVRDDG